MTITYERLIITSLYIMGRININGEGQYYDTLELTDSQIPGSLMKVTLLKTKEEQARILALVADDYDYQNADSDTFCIGRITKGISYRSLKNKTGIIVGRKDFPGSLTLSRKIYDRLVDRIEKCLNKPASRRETIQFVIRPTAPQHRDVHPYWLSDPMHGCPPTTIHCENNSHGDVLVYDGDELIKVHTLEEQKARYSSEG